MGRKKGVFSINIEETAMDFFNHLLQEKPRISFFIPLILIAWAIERWVFFASTWVPFALAMWTTIQCGRYQQKLLVEDLDKKWKQIILNVSKHLKLRKPRLLERVEPQEFSLGLCPPSVALRGMRWSTIGDQ